MLITPKKERVLKAASECFAHLGYDKTTLDDIGKMAGLNKSSLYYYYRNKEMIFTDVILYETEKFILALQEKVKKYKDCETKIVKYLSERLFYYQQVLILNNLSLDTIRQIEPMFDKFYKTVLDKEIGFLAEILNECQKEAQPGASSRRRVAETILVIADAVRFREVHGSNARFASEVDFEKTESDIKLAVKLIIRALKKN
jgi:AcrR family transcriptional regulator